MEFGVSEALLVMDMQNGILERIGSRAEALLKATETAIEVARSQQCLVIFVRVAFREGAPEVSPKNQSFARLTTSTDLWETDASTAIHARLAPQPDDIVVVKRRVSAFSGSDLDVVLRAKSVDSLVVSGIATSGVVLSTVRLAADLDFRLTVLRDACADMDDDVHRMLMDKVFPRQAAVLETADWASRLTN